MKKTLILLCFPIFLFSQKTYNFPNSYDFEIERFDLEYNWGSNYANLYPVGWSNDGKIAYLSTILYPEGLGAFVSSFIIQDMKTDEIIEVVYFDEFADEINIKEEWFNNSKIHDLLNYHKIKNEGFGEINFSSFTSSFKILFEKKSENYELSAYYGQDSSKVISYFQSDESMFYGGFFKSPYEERIAILIIVRSAGFEGEQDFDFNFYGKKLD